MELTKKLLNRETKLTSVGPGYVALPLAAAFARKMDVIAFDINEQKI
jgi:UDP-N-acetyl-D-galactosamine dehydrogenase